MKNSSQRQAAVRNFLSERNIGAFIIPSGDNHFGEYFQDYFACRKWVSGFTGSAGTLVITQKGSALWTDSRYFVQALSEFEGSDITLMKMKTEGTPTIAAWLKEQLSESGVVAVDGNLFSKADYESLESSLCPLKLAITDDPFNAIWKDRPNLRFNKIFSLSTSVTGESTSVKLKRIRLQLPENEDYVYFLSTCDDIAWLCNLRGSDIPYNPLFASYIAITKERALLFVNNNVVDEGVRKELEKEGVELMSYELAGDYLLNLGKSVRLIASPDKISVSLYEKARSGGAAFTPDVIRGGVTGSLKAVKNKTEQEGFRMAMKNDAVAWVKFMIYLESEIKKRPNGITEFELAGKIAEFRAQSPDYRGESFSPIVAYGANAALPHYSPSEENQVFIDNKGFLLVDTGAQYLYGTTDTTRTFAIGDLSYEQKCDYTFVLKGMINLSKAVFPKGTRGSSLDMLARGPLCSAGKMYMHGTGHGVGHYLCVHEGPQSIRMEENPVELMPGMVTSNEPAVYVKDSYGIRTENLILCKEHEVNSFGTFYSFETLTLVPIDTRAVIVSLLSDDEVEWLNGYHKMVCETISPLLDSDCQKWLAARCACIG